MTAAYQGGAGPAVPPHIAAGMQAALEQAREAALAGEVPVGAVVLRGTTVVARAQNRMLRDHDGTSHAELLALRAAASVLGESRLGECTERVAPVAHLSHRTCCTCCACVAPTNG